MTQPKNILGYRVLPIALAPEPSFIRGAKRAEDGQVTRITKENDLKYCPDCRKVYQNSTVSGRTYLDYYEDMPTLGKERKVCPKCKVGLNESK